MLQDLLVSEVSGLRGGRYLRLELKIEAFVEFTRVESHSLLSVFVLGLVPFPNSISPVVTPAMVLKTHSPFQS